MKRLFLVIVTFMSFGLSQGQNTLIEELVIKASKGDANAMNRIGGLYHYGKGVEVNYEEALKWYKKAAEKGYAAGLNDLGYLYEKGLGVAKDYKMAFEYYIKAAKHKDEKAMKVLGM